jgi:hypothetical protein
MATIANHPRAETHSFFYKVQVDDPRFLSLYFVSPIMKSLITMFVFCASMVIQVVAPNPSYKCIVKVGPDSTECGHQAESGTKLFKHQLDHHSDESVCYYLPMYILMPGS